MTHTTRSPGRSPAPSREESIDRALQRVSDAPLRQGNRVTLLRNGPDTYGEWLAEIAGARKWVHLENYIFRGDAIGRHFADALSSKAREGVPVRVLYDWYGSKATPATHWRDLRAAGVEVRAFNPFAVQAPLEVFCRDHRKSLGVDGRYGSVGGVCIADRWTARSLKTGLGYRDTAVGFSGPVVADLERAFAQVWGRSGAALPADELPRLEAIGEAGEQAARLIIQEPAKMRVSRMLQIVSAGARERLWIADAYFLAGPHLYQALMSAARDGVDVRLLLPATNNLPIVSAMSRGSYRQLLEAGVQIFEYGGLMMHAKTSVVDGWSSRIGSTNLNPTGLLNWEIDLIAEGRSFGAEMEEMFEEDLADSLPVRLDGFGRPKGEQRRRTPSKIRSTLGSEGSGSRVAATAARTGAAMIRGEEELRGYERTVAVTTSAGLLGVTLLGVRFPRSLAWPVAAATGLVGASGLLRSLRRRSPARGNG